MQIRRLKHHEIDFQKWDQCVLSSPDGLTYALSWYLDIVCPNWEAIVADDYAAVFPLTRRKKFGFSYLYQPAFTQQCGVFCSGKKADENVVHEFLSAIPKEYRLIEIQLNTGNSVKSESGFEIIRKRTYHLSFNSTIEKIRSSYSENLRRNLKKAAKANHVLSFEENVQELIELFKNNRGKEGVGLKTDDYHALERLISEGRKRKSVEIPSIRNAAGELIAGAVFLQSAHSLIFLFSGANSEAKESGAMSFLIDAMIERQTPSDKVLDFEGSMDDDLARYYRSFGSQEIVYLQIRKNNLPPLIRRFK